MSLFCAILKQSMNMDIKPFRDAQLHTCPLITLSPTSVNKRITRMISNYCTTSVVATDVVYSICRTKKKEIPG